MSWGCWEEFPGVYQAEYFLTGVINLPKPLKSGDIFTVDIPAQGTTTTGEPCEVSKLVVTSIERGCIHATSAEEGKMCRAIYHPGTLGVCIRPTVK